MKDFINKSQITSKLDSQSRDFLIKNARKIDVKAGDLIIRNGSKDKNKIFFIKKGKISQKMPIKKVSEFKDGDFFGELPILTGADKHIGNFIAEENTELIKINKMILERLLNTPETQTQMQEKVMRKIAKNKSLFNK